MAGTQTETRPPERFLTLCRGFWKGRTAPLAWGLSLGLIALVLLTLGAQVAMNSWHRTFFDALENKNWPALVGAMWMLPLFVFWYTAVMTGQVLSRMSLQLRWREWLTEFLLSRWIDRQRYYRLQFTLVDQGAPEYRIAEDVRLAIDQLVDFVLGFLGAVFSAITFAAILWQVAGSYSFKIGNASITIPAYMAVAAVLYAAIVTALITWVGRPLIDRVAFKNEREARFRADMTRLRENAESVALMRGDPGERATIRTRFDEVRSAWFSIIRQQGIVGLVLNTNGALFPLLPVLLVTPKYLSGALTLGAVMQVVAAFTAVQAALIWFVDHFVKIAEWYASVRRVDELLDALGDLDLAPPPQAGPGIRIDTHPGRAILLENLEVLHRTGVTVIAESSVRIEQGEKVLFSGASGTGKSTLIRALAGLWPWGAGRIRLPEGARIAFVPQKAYIPTGTLRQVLAYPMPSHNFTSAELAEALRRCGLGDIAGRLDEVEHWDSVLSGGERQRLAFARVLLAQPDILILDEATSALDETGQEEVLRLISEAFAQATVISVGHRTGLAAYHERRITLIGRETGAILSSRAIKRPRKWNDVQMDLTKTG
ncbi:ABC transporter ATP-binding protein/permease [Rhabdaerophilum sp. SD176]|uniref:ABC transporter ATP-binding protein/permease n=1 Tax=Rhabdaerophilum sp. SD176 TaxID=2983548 RepID=UPI0024DFBB7B|nr:ABC transporter ATP-binding protein/permease [Rhabdaerophilum sp. SD176]